VHLALSIFLVKRMGRNCVAGARYIHQAGLQQECLVLPLVSSVPHSRALPLRRLGKRRPVAEAGHVRHPAFARLVRQSNITGRAY